MSWPSKKVGSDPLLWGRNSISDVIADARASLQQPSRPFTPRNLAQVLALFFFPRLLLFSLGHKVRSLHGHNTAVASEQRPSTPVLLPQAVRASARSAAAPFNDLIFTRSAAAGSLIQQTCHSRIILLAIAASHQPRQYGAGTRWRRLEQRQGPPALFILGQLWCSSQRYADCSPRVISRCLRKRRFRTRPLNARRRRASDAVPFTPAPRCTCFHQFTPQQPSAHAISNSSPCYNQVLGQPNPESMLPTGQRGQCRQR